MRKLLIFVLSACLGGCSLYRDYQRADDLPTDSLFKADSVAMTDSTSLGDIPWQELFTDSLLQEYIRFGLENNTDMQVAMLRIDQAMARLKCAKLAYLPSAQFDASGKISSIDWAKAQKSYDIGISASWENDLFGKLRNARKSEQASLLAQQAYQQAVRSNLIANIASSYFSIMALDSSVEICESSLSIWREQIRVIQARLNVGEENENALAAARANYYGLETTLHTLIRQRVETQNALCALLGTTSGDIRRGRLEQVEIDNKFSIGIPARILSCRPDVVYAEMQLASSFYDVNQARAAFYPNLTLSGSIGWTNSLGQAVSNPASWIASALASLTQPIFARGKLKMNLRVSQDEEKIALANFKQALLDAGREVNDALSAIESADKNLSSVNNQVEQLERYVATTEALYRVENATYLELLSARQSLLSARLDQVSFSLDRLKYIVSLYTALGGGR